MTLFKFLQVFDGSEKIYVYDDYHKCKLYNGVVAEIGFIDNSKSLLCSEVVYVSIAKNTIYIRVRVRRIKK